MDISVVVPCYNAEGTIKYCIEALFSQNYPADQYEIIIVDNNSTDKSAEIVRRYPRVRLLSERKQGSYVARNRGLAEAKGEIIAFTDSDCVPVIGWLENIMAAMRSPGVDIVQGSRRFASNSTSLSLLAAYGAEQVAYIFSSCTREIYYGYTNNMAVRRSLFDRLGSFQEIARGADTVFVRRAVDEYACDVVRYCPGAGVQHLEITSIWDFYRKQFIYGQSTQRNRKLLGSSKPLSPAERRQLLKRTAQGMRYSLIKAVFLFFLLYISGVCYNFGQRRVTC